MLNNIGGSVKQAFSSIRSNKLRSALTMLGIIIGVASVIVLLAAGKGAQQLILDQVEDLGSNIIFVLAGGDGGQRRGPPAAARGIIVKTLKLSDVDAIKNPANVPSVGRISAFTSLARAQLQIGTPGDTEELSVNAQGRDRMFFEMRNYELEEGRFWTDSEERSLRRVALLGSNARDTIFGEGAKGVSGQRIKLKNQSFEIIGVLKEKGSPLGGAFGQSDDDNIIVPVRTAQKFLLGVDYIQGFMVEARTEALIEQAVSEMELILRERHNLKGDKENDFSIRTQKEALELLGTITGVFTIFLAAIAAISLIVGGIGIMNIMLVVVTERTREIGLRKAVGARRRDILIQFLIEAVMVTMVGGIIGIIIGLFGSYGISIAGGWEFTIDGDAILLASGVSALFGIVFGLYPANKASRLNPIDALRYE